VAESYERRRPPYPPEIVAFVVERFGLGPGKTVVDVAAGTGKLTRQLVPTGARVIPVEPLAEMRAQPLQHAVQEIIGSYLPRDREFGLWREAVACSGLFGPLETIEASFEQLVDAEGLAERIGAYIARLRDEVRAEALAQVRRFGEARPTTPFAFRYGVFASVLLRC
jgi:hypothetical protein